MVGARREKKPKVLDGGGIKCQIRVQTTGFPLDWSLADTSRTSLMEDLKYKNEMFLFF